MSKEVKKEEKKEVKVEKKETPIHDSHKKSFTQGIYEGRKKPEMYK